MKKLSGAVYSDILKIISKLYTDKCMQILIWVYHRHSFFSSINTVFKICPPTGMRQM